MISTSPRAAPLPPDERRAALIASTLTLILAEGPDVSTRQIAQAAGVAEGTIFRVFATKDELVRAAITSAFDSTALIGDLTAVDRTAPLGTRLVAAVEILQRHTTRVFRLVDALGMEAVTRFDRERRARLGEDDCDPRAVVRQTIVNLIVPDRDLLRCTAQEAARRLQLLTAAGSHPKLVEDDPLSPKEIVSMLLNGIRRPREDDDHFFFPETPGHETPRGDPQC
ncbi:TetR/AcrR family transcriptional regulator [Streptosporangium algeriense]|uniref:TetR/AcrR family transcriptional regulator n=1 Tax=Streptosporangium algeriense TaxID=1682748 RepID=A0ABW3DVB3_9ACTN